MEAGDTATFSVGSCRGSPRCDGAIVCASREDYDVGAFSGSPQLSSVSVGRNVTIGAMAFYNSTALECLELPSGADAALVIGTRAFASSPVLGTVVIPSGSTIQSDAFDVAPSEGGTGVVECERAPTAPERPATRSPTPSSSTAQPTQSPLTVRPTASPSSATPTVAPTPVPSPAPSETQPTMPFCAALQRGQSAVSNCIPLPGLLPGAVINTDWRFGTEHQMASRPVANHSSDGAFGIDEWDNVVPALGRFTNAYFDYADGFLYILNDWIYNPDREVSPTCYNLFFAFTGNGREQWELRVYGSGLVEASLNGELLAQPNATGAVGFGTSPLRPGQNHTIFELAFAASPGRFGVQLHDPGPRFECSVLETEIVNFVGTASRGSAPGHSGGLTLETVNATEYERRRLLTELPTASPATSAPTSRPTPSPTEAPSSSPSSSAPITSEPTPSPTASPSTPEPTPNPTTVSPTAPGVTFPPTAAPTTASPTPTPTESPATPAPTPGPTSTPTTSSPTPTPTASPTTPAPTPGPTPTPTTSPATPAPTPGPTLMSMGIPRSEPTGYPTIAVVDATTMNPDPAGSNNNPEDGDDNFPWLVIVILIGVIITCCAGLAAFYIKSKQNSAARPPSFSNPIYQMQKEEVYIYDGVVPGLGPPADGETEI